MDVAWWKSKKQALGITDAQLGEALGVERSVANKVINGRVQMNVRKVPAIAKLFGVSHDEVLIKAGYGAEITELADVADDQAPSPLSQRDDDTVEIKALDLSFSMGPGSAVDDYIEETPLRFDLGYIRSFTRTRTDHLRLARGVGESMFPTLVSSDQVWIDTSQRQLTQQDRIWAVSLFGAAAIKRLRAIGSGRVLVISDNPLVDSQEVDVADLLIAGRVIRFMRDL